MAHKLRGLVRLGIAACIVLPLACSATGNDTPKGSGGAASGGAGGSASGGTSGASGGSAGSSTGGSAGVSTGGSAGSGGNAGMGGNGTATEKCGDGQDNDQNNIVDEGCACPLGTTQACWTGAPDRRSKGACKDGVQSCETYGEFTAWGPCVGEVLPTAEVPGNGADEDCDGSDPGGCVPEATTEICTGGRDADCDGAPGCLDADCASICNCSGVEICDNGKDDDCDTQIDCKDADCVQATACKPVGGCMPVFPFFVEVACGNNADDDCDGKIDCADPDCKRPGSCGCANTETSCTNGSDEDCDGSVDCSDRECQKCTPGTTRWCDDPTYCHWGKQACKPDNTWGECIETTDRPGNCTGSLYSADCCKQAGGCCQNYPVDDQSVGNCSGIVECK